MPAPTTPLAQSPRVEVVTITALQLEELVAAAAARGYRQAAEERERAMAALADRLERAISGGGLKPWMSTREAALYCGRAEATLRRWIRDGLPARRGPRGYLITREALDAWRSGSGPAAHNDGTET